MSDEHAITDFRIHHTMLPVASLDRSIAFYTGLLGMAVMGRRLHEARRPRKLPMSGTAIAQASRRSN